MAAAAVMLSWASLAAGLAPPTRRAVLGLVGLAAVPQAGTADASTARAQLLDAIARGADVEAAIEALIPFDPSAGRGARSTALDGRWRLIWSQKAEAFSPLLGLPVPLRPQSYQLVGAVAAPVVGADRVAQLLEFPGGISLILSSGVAPAASQPRVLDIFPPFRFELALGGGGGRWTAVEAGSDAEFRAQNGRDRAAQAAQPNEYEQRYLETSGLAGDLRVSTIVAGDPVIVGAVFVHVRE